MKINVLTLTWNGLDKLEQLRPSLMDNLKSTGLEFTWHIRDNGSTDGTIEKISTWENVKSYPISHNRDNFAQGMNYLFEQCKPNDEDFILLLNNDMYFGDTDSINKMISLFNDNNIGLVGARILYPETNKLQHAGVCFIKKYGYLPFHLKHNEISTPADENNIEMQAVTAAIALIKANEYKEICKTNKSGRVGMDEMYFWCFEDIDACLSIKYNLNKKIMYCGKTFIYHFESFSLKKNPVNKILMPHNVEYFKKKWWGKYKLED